MGVSFTGDWGKLLGNLDRVKRELKSDTGKRIGRALMKIERKVLDHLDAQDLGWDPLTKPYAKRKALLGLDPDTLRATNTMYENITTDQADEYHGAVGVMRGVKTKDGEELTDIAIIHEQPDNDGKKIPPRKLWEPTFKEMEKEIPAGITGGVRKFFEK
ncbi:MAG: hypothetical protein CVU57_04325 [Deltaproteobacteria bacterium HGW-Deltaproteobacteria-15]|jgi:hypothetical protein|nr:MAG: hypothetical protein CVU57_04325 [Deltaproteobacteria bacterium HGW-Deltaproteobacteria-15]